MPNSQQSVIPTIVDEFLTPQEVAKALRIGRSALYYWLLKRELPYYKFGRLIRIRATDLRAFVEKHRVTGSHLARPITETAPHHKDTSQR